VYPTAALRNGFLVRNILKDLGTLFPSSATPNNGWKAAPNFRARGGPTGYPGSRREAARKK
jgi:hypothetical protein